MIETLAIECSTSRGSVAGRRAGELVFSERFTAARGHGSALFEVVQRALKTLSTCDQVVVGLGPGSYSGVRIAIAAAIGLEIGLDCTLLGIPSIAAIQTDEKSYLVTGDARRQQFFLARVENGIVTEGPDLLSLAELAVRLAPPPPLPVFTSAPIESLPHLEIGFPAAEILTRLGEQRRGIIATGALEPIYLREPHITQPQNPSNPPLL